MASAKDLKKFASVSTEVLSILDQQLATISDAANNHHETTTYTTPVDQQILFYKMKADAHRYLAELAPIDSRARVANRFPAESAVEADCALAAYKIASGMAQEHLEACHPLRLMLAFNFSSFYADVRHSLRMANHIAKAAYESACEIVHMLSGTEYDDAIRVLQLIRDNISNWSLQLATGDAFEDDEESDVDVDEDWEQDDMFEEDGDDGLVNAGDPSSMTILGSPASSPVSRRASFSGQERRTSSTSRTNSLSNAAAENNNNIENGGMLPSASAPILKGHGGRALRPDSAISDSRPDSAPRSRRPSISSNTTPERRNSKTKKKRRRSISLSSEGPIPPDHLESLLRNAEEIPVGGLTYQDDGGNNVGNLSQALFELFHSYLEGDVGTPVATLLSDGTTKTLENAILQASQSTGLRLNTSSLCRMLHDFHVVPKMMNDQTVQALVNVVALANTEGSNGTDRKIVLLYESKFNLDNKRRRKRPKFIDIKIKNKDGNVKDLKKSAYGGSSSSNSGNAGIRSQGQRRPSNGGNGGKDLKRPDIHNIDFYEFVDVLGRIAIVVYKLNPGGIKNAKQSLNKPAEIMTAFFRHQMFLFGGQTLEKEAEWRQKVRRPWEAHDRQKRLASPKAMMRPPLPGDPIRLMDRAASKGKLHVPQLAKDPRMPQFRLTKSGDVELHAKHWTRSLRQIFDFYRRINTVIKKQKVISSSSGGDLFSDIGGMNNIITLSDFIKFLSDFKICPQVLHKDLVRDIFSTATRKKQHGSRPNSANKKDSNKNQLNRPTTAPSIKSFTREEEGWSLMGATWDAFLDCIARCAIAADFSEPTKYVGDVEKVIGFMISLELDEGGDWRKKMRSYGSPPRTSKMIRESTMGRSTGIALVRVGAKGSPARGAGLRAVRAATSSTTSL